jgi:hypothetical protein
MAEFVLLMIVGFICVMAWLYDAGELAQGMIPGC